MTDTTREPQYQRAIDLRDSKGLARLGLATNQAWEDDPKHILFMLARYKFVAKMFSGMKDVLEVGCADGFGARLIVQEVQRLTAVDFDPLFVEDAVASMDRDWHFECRVHDILQSPVPGVFDGVYTLDVLEHIPKNHEDRFLSNIVESIADSGALIVGTPSLESQTYASASSKQGHVNCKNHAGLQSLLSTYFHSVFIFSMNDEVVHTGFYPMAHYLMALCANKRRD